VTALDPVGPGASLLSAEDIDFSYGRLQVLFGVSLQVAPGEALALLGTNGAGKSTLLRVVSGLAHPSSGTVLFDGQDVTQVRAEQLPARGLVLIPGGRAIFPDLTVAENLEMQGLANRQRRERARQQLALVYDVFPRLAERLRQHAGSLSGGEQQQLALAKALLLEPKLLCIDELSLGLAPVVVQELMETVRGIQRAGVALILVEQSLNIAAAMCDRAVFMEKGAIRFEGRTRELLDRDDIARAVFLGQA
jgi:ABC-type branched-subunit amino acid transport system ATPase component